MINICTAASENHSKSLQQFISSVYTNVKCSFNLFIYNLGLSESVLSKIKTQYNYNNVFLKDFDYQKYPDYYDINVNAGEYAWKSAIIKEVSEHINNGILLWCDAGNVITNSFDFNNVITFINTNKIYSPSSSGNVKRWTHPAVLQKFNINSNEILNFSNRNGAILGFNLNLKEVKDFITNFNNYSMQKDYIAPQGSNRENHRQDQALFTILYFHFIKQYNTQITDSYMGINIHKDCD